MKCAACRPLLSKYIDNEATPAEVRQVEEHIGGCARCSAALTEFRLMRAVLTDAPRRMPDPRLRAQVFRALDAYDAAHPPEERRAGRARPAPAPAASRPAWSWAGNLAGAVAVLLLVVSGVLIAQTSAPQPPDGKAPTRSVPVIGYPTPMSPIAEAQPTGAATGMLGEPDDSTPRTATGTPAWRPELEDEGVEHKIQDARFGYILTVPRNWWSAPVPATGQPVVSRRQVAPWPLEDPAAGSPHYLLIDVLANPRGLNVAQARQEALVPAHYDQAVRYGRLEGVRGETTDTLLDRDEVYLFDDAVIYRLSAVIPWRGKDGEERARRKAAALAEIEEIRRGFDAAGGPLRDLGYAPALVLRDGNLWAVEPDGSSPRALTSAGNVRAFRLAPDLRQVALVTAAGPGQTGPWGSRIELLDRVDGKGKLQNIWFANEIHDVDWYGNEELVVIADDPEAVRGLGIYRIPARPGAGAEHHLVELRNHPQAASLQVSPDRLWIAFLAETTPGSKVGELYGVRQDGSALGPLTSRSDGSRSVQEFAWLPQPRGGQPAGAEELVLLERQSAGTEAGVEPVLLTVPPPGSGHSPTRLALDTRLGQQQARFLTVNAQGQVAYAVFNSAGAWQGLRTADSQAAAPANTVREVSIRPGAAPPSALEWSPDAAHLLVQTGGTTAPVGLQRLDLATGASVTVLDPNQ
jgi:hypothetical protein